MVGFVFQIVVQPVVLAIAHSIPVSASVNELSVVTAMIQLIVVAATPAIDGCC